MISWLFWDPHPEIFILPVVDFPILWYGVFFAVGFWAGIRLFAALLVHYFHTASVYKKFSPQELKQKARQIADQFTLYSVIATLLGARLGHFLFYESPSNYLANPWELLRFRNGGLASHGAAIAIICATILFSKRIRAKEPDCGLDWIRLLDFTAIPAALAGCCIRVGNFFNQEILGTISPLPWAVVFGHPADGSLPAPRHPVQLYEALWYLTVFVLLWRLSQKPSFLLLRGKLIGVFLVLVFLFRFGIEFLKLEQSRLLSDASLLTMGQLLSVPGVIIGIWLYRKHRLQKLLSR
ncbi:MAG: prolipoprotein diacylglyceryl transferase [Chlamydiia bacterium]|nr:prolipoprotein diacylglyceryl transferase [Chlamydiia bacterium]